MQLVRPNTRRKGDLVHHSILGLEDRIVALKAKEVLTDYHRQSVVRISKMLKTMCGEFKGYHYDIVANPESHEAARQGQVFFRQTPAQ